MLPTTEVVGFPPRRGFGPRLGNSQAGCTTSHSPMVRRLPLLQRGAVGGLAHTVLGTRSVPMCSKIVLRFSNALIAGEPRGRHLGSEQGISHPPCGGQHRMYPASTGRFGTSLLSSVGAASVDGSRLRGRITAARASGPVWTTHTTMTNALTDTKRTDLETHAGQRVVVGGTSDALLPTAEAVGFRAVQL